MLPKRIQPSMILAEFLPQSGQRRGGLTAALRLLGALGLFFLAILDSSPLPTFGGPDILTAVLAATHRNPWYEYAAVATTGSVIGAYITFRLARRAGYAYLDGKFGQKRVPRLLSLFREWGTSVLAASTAIPFPFPTSVFFAAAGVSDYDTREFIAVVLLSRAARYSAVALIADYYGRHFLRVLRHPTQYWGWLLIFVAVISAIVTGGILLQKRLEPVPEAGLTEAHQRG
jgi:membrane protein YqaA with SNARE-associated domain